MSRSDPYIKILGIFLLSLVITLPARADNIKIIYSPSVTGDKKELAKKAFEVFRDKCAPLMSEYVDDIEQIEISAYEDDGCWSYGCENYGWAMQVEIRPKIKEDAKKIPPSVYAWGHTLYYDLGGGNKPGIRIQKSQSQVLCGVQDGRGSDVFKSVPELSFLHGSSPKKTEEKPLDDKTFVEQVKFLKFCKTLFDQAKYIDLPCRPFFEALGQLELGKAAIIARAIHPLLNHVGLEMTKINVPDLDNDEAENGLKEAKNTWVSAYANRVGIVEGCKIIDIDPISASKETKGLGDVYVSQLTLAMAQIMFAGKLIGIEPSRITKLAKAE